MTREEAIAVLQKIKPAPRRADGKSTAHTLETIALDMAIKELRDNSYTLWKESYEEECTRNTRLEEKIKTLEQEQKIKVLDNDEVARKLGTVDIYKASAWITLLKDLECLGMKICEVEE